MSMPYYILAPSYTPLSGGVKALYKLCQDLNVAGQTAFISGKYATTTSSPCAPIQNPKPTENFIAVIPDLYPETLPGAAKTVRFLLYHAGFAGGPKEFAATDIMYYFSRNFIHQNRNPSHILTVPILNTSRFFLPHTTKKRKGSCFIARKFRAAGGIPNQHPSDSFEITIDYNKRDQGYDLAELFQRVEMVYSYDETYMVYEALLAGAWVTLIPNHHMTSFHEIEGFPITPVNAFENYHQSVMRYYNDQLPDFIKETQK